MRNPQDLADDRRGDDIDMTNVGPGLIIVDRHLHWPPDDCPEVNRDGPRPRQPGNTSGQQHRDDSPPRPHLPVRRHAQSLVLRTATRSSALTRWRTTIAEKTAAPMMIALAIR